MAPTGSFFFFLSVGICFFVEALAKFEEVLYHQVFFLHSPKNRMLRFLVLFAETLSAFLGILMLGKIPRSDSGKWIFQGHFTALKKFLCWRHFGYTSSISKVQETHDFRGFMDFFRFGCMSTGFVEVWPSYNFSMTFPIVPLQGLPFSSFFTFG